MRSCVAVFIGCMWAVVAAGDGQVPPQQQAGSLLGGRLTTIESESVRTKAWTRSAVSVLPDGSLSGDDGVVGEKASTDAINTVAARAGEISDASAAAITDALDYLHSKTGNMARTCCALAISIAPETVRSNLTGYVVETTSDGTNDTQYVWYSQDLLLRPNRYVTYSYFGGEASVKAEWVNWTSNGVTRTVNGKTWSGCHACTVARPSWAVGKSCLDLPNETWGGSAGMNFGDMAIRVRGKLALTAVITNSITGSVIYFDNGFAKEIP